jgi:4-amino-4-deoxy-L-arabinose transferase-like glycosyltransferase
MKPLYTFGLKNSSTEVQQAVFAAVKPKPSNAVIIPVVATVIFLLPFVGKAFHLDDPMFIWAAKQILKHPADFRGFTVNWYGTEMPASSVEHNPPLFSYYIAPFGWLSGWNEIALHAACLVPAVAAALGTYYLAREFYLQPISAVVASLATLLTPAFLVTGTTVMSDMMTLAFWVWAVVLWIRGMNSNSYRSMFFSAVLIMFCSFTRYVGISLPGLLFAYSLMQRHKPGVWLLFFLIPVTALITYEFVTNAFYGKGLLWDAAGYTTRISWIKEGSEIFSKGLIGLVFMGGGIATALFYAPLLWSRKTLFAGIVLTTLFMFILIYFGEIGEFPLKDAEGVRWSLIIQLGLTAASGVIILFLAGIDFFKSRDADSLLLGLWVIGIFIFAGFINWTINVRGMLLLVPPAAVLLMRQISRRSKAGYKTGVWRISLPLIPAAIIAVSVTWADYSWAGTARKAAEAIHKEFPRGLRINVWFQGHWGFQYYMEANGYKPIDFKASSPNPKDIVIIPSHNVNIHITWLKGKARPLKTVLQFSPCRWLATMNVSLGAGFYSHRGGPLPYVIGRVEPEKYSFYIFD